ncbi:hypothetical protein SynBIOSE41_01886 [Synechococcus sp. BIOS-E4-1]|nr:hypothetical protein SynBIOSE41_01886 [Synechococcus sp. BIOS-E4-1]
MATNSLLIRSTSSAKRSWKAQLADGCRAWSEEELECDG